MSEVENEKQETENIKAEQPIKKSPGILSVVQSVLAAMIGIQSNKKHKEDFESGSVTSYIVVGVIMVIIFIFTLIGIVNSILENAGQ